MRVLVTRAKVAAERTARRIEAAGHVAILAPVTVVVATQAPMPQGPVDALLVTSANALEVDTGYLADLLHLPVYAVGQVTATAARRAGFRDVRTGEGDAAALVSLVRLTLPRPASLLYLTGEDRKPTMEQGLAEARYTVDAVESYRAEAIAGWSEAVTRGLADDRVDAALHFSSRSAGLALGFARQADLIGVFLRLAHCCLSEDVATPLRAAGAERIAVAASPEENALLALIAPRSR